MEHKNVKIGMRVHGTAMGEEWSGKVVGFADEDDEENSTLARPGQWRIVLDERIILAGNWVSRLWLYPGDFEPDNTALHRAYEEILKDAEVTFGMAVHGDFDTRCDVEFKTVVHALEWLKNRNLIGRAAADIRPNDSISSLYGPVVLEVRLAAFALANK